MASALNLIIEPPAVTRSRASKADKDVLAAMVGQISSSTWVTDGKTYPTSQDAALASGVYRRALPPAKQIQPHMLVSKVWGTDKKGAVVTDRNANADWKFAFTIDKQRAPRKKRTKTTSAS